MRTKLRFPSIGIWLILTSVSLIFIWPNLANAVSCSAADITLSSQSEVDRFQADYGGGGVCEFVTGDLIIGGDDITSLAPLSDLASIGNDLVVSDNPLLTNVSDLSSITQIGRHLDITLNPVLTDLDGLSGLTSLGGVLGIRDNSQLNSLEGLSNVESVGLSLVIDDNDALSEIVGLAKLTHLGLHLWIRRNTLLTDVTSLSGLTNIGGSLVVAFNPSLASIDLAGLATVSSDVLVLENENLADIGPLLNLTKVGRDLFITDNPLLGDCSHLRPLLDGIDDGVPGPGPGLSGVPDVGNEVILYGNQHGCNSMQQVLFQIMASGFESTNQITTIEYEAGQGSCDIMIGSDGLPIISYQKTEGSSQIRTAKCSDASCSRDGLIISVIDDSPGNSKGGPEIAVAGDGFPFIQYGASFFAPSWIKSAKCNDLACLSGDESVSTLTTTNGLAGGGSVAIDNDGLPVISYIVQNNQLAVIKCNDVACSDGDEINSVVGSSAGAYFDTSIAIGADDFPVISYVSDDGNLALAKCNDPACQGGDESISIVEESESLLGLFSSVAIGADDYPIVAYIDNSARSLKVANCNDPACSGGDEQITTIDVGSTDTLTSPSVAIGSDGMPIISYSDASNSSLWVAKCIDFACSEENVSIYRLDTTARYTSIAIGSDGRPVISYCGSIKQAEPVKVLRCGTVDCRP